MSPTVMGSEALFSHGSFNPYGGMTRPDVWQHVGPFRPERAGHYSCYHVGY
ncbi:hypothetical protein NJ7G_1849 [Natrinema sp. J7-2]|nr:hypothetical protein NJ7G_1849 [Natrinema sp. J7-2]